MLAVTVNWIVAGPTPLVPEGSETHDTSAAAVHGHDPPVATVTVPEPPAAVNVTVGLAIVHVQEGVAGVESWQPARPADSVTRNNTAEMKALSDILRPHSKVPKATQAIELYADRGDRASAGEAGCGRGVARAGQRRPWAAARGDGRPSYRAGQTLVESRNCFSLARRWTVVSRPTSATTSKRLGLTP